MPEYRLAARVPVTLRYRYRYSIFETADTGISQRTEKKFALLPPAAAAADGDGAGDDE